MHSWWWITEFWGSQDGIWSQNQLSNTRNGYSNMARGKHPCLQNHRKKWWAFDPFDLQWDNSHLGGRASELFHSVTTLEVEHIDGKWIAVKYVFPLREEKNPYIYIYIDIARSVHIEYAFFQLCSWTRTQLYLEYAQRYSMWRQLYSK